MNLWFLLIKIIIKDSSKTVATFPEMTAAAPAPMTATSAAVAAIKNNAIDDLLGLETELSNLQERDGQGFSKIKTY